MYGPLRSIRLGLAIALGLVAAANAGEISFSQDVQPILAKRCYACHGPADQEAGLALNRRETAIAKLESGGRAVVPGNPDESILLERVASDDHDFRMPPEGEPLSAEEIAILRSWIESGAKYAKHWAFVKPHRPSPPSIGRPEHARNEIDRFVLAKLEDLEIAPAPRAAPATLIRRLYLDLIGLLPSSDQVAAFENGETTYVALVDELLASEHFGERWGRHWLDLARYADSFGYERDDVRPNAWRYRDWVVRSFNDNQPYDEFIVEQLAGDLLDDPTVEQRIATGLHRMNIKNNESGINKEDYRNRETVDRVNTTSTAMLGLTLGCCQCHAHKYDPFSHADYYSFYAFFNNVSVKDADIDGTPDERKLYEQAKSELDAKRKLLEERGKLLGDMRKHASFTNWAGEDESKVAQVVASLDLTPDLEAAVRDSKQHERELATFWETLRSREDDTAKAKRQLSVQERHLPKPYIMQMEEVAEKRRTTHVLERGDFKSKGEEVSASTPGVLPTFASRGDIPDRLDLARWITSRDNPLASRVAVNHIWKHLLGRGIVTSMDDFGTQGEPPTHPQLLDWLAVELMESGWDRKHLIRTIVLSATYQQSSAMRGPANLQQEIAFDKDNPLFARQVRFRVESETVRDIFLCASGLLHNELGGPTIHPVIPVAIRDLGYKYKTRWIVSEGSQRHRRGLYIHFKRTNPYPTLLMFDAPESNVCVAMRNRSNTPLQALATLNDPVFVECAQAFGKMLADSPNSDKHRLATLAKRCFGRSFESREFESLSQLLSKERQWYGKHAEEAAAMVGDYGSGKVADAEVAAWAAVARTVLNLDEFVTRE